MHRRYWLARHCFICVVDDVLVCLDTRTHGYFFYEAAKSNAVCQHVVGWPTIASSDKTPFDSSDVIMDLLKQGVLVQARNQGKAATQAISIPPEAPLMEEYEQKPISITAKEALMFFASVLMTMRLPRWEEKMIDRRLRRGGVRPSPNGLREPTATEIARMRRIFLIFERLRPFLWEMKDRRRSEQFVLLKFFELQGIRPRWILAIAKDPLRRTSWLQFGHVVIDETPEIASMFVPVAIA